ncbi:hypothetical protein KIN20_021256 [Parelaphostrongylus tenuis]|uniref:Uncharacterized protein n=1 Tax=Parelaphostrongylus tenuis TaxID=148309 RepID=A0AAD5QUF0_PARTN|nr:hypothetical protein KIN20_021256 [Parelaphostrongylus tenuis]
MRKPLTSSNFKPKIVVKESDRIARTKAAREAYRSKSETSNIRCEKCKKVVNEVNVETKENKRRCHDSPSARRSTLARDFVFKPVEESLDMIFNGGIRMPATGRYTSIGGSCSLNYKLLEFNNAKENLFTLVHVKRVNTDEGCGSRSPFCAIGLPQPPACDQTEINWRT